MTGLIIGIVLLILFFWVFARIDARQRENSQRRETLRLEAAAKQVPPEAMKREESRTAEALAAREAKAELERLPPR